MAPLGEGISLGKFKIELGADDTELDHSLRELTEHAVDLGEKFAAAWANAKIIKAFETNQNALVRLDSAMQATGTTAAGARNHLIELAESLQKTTRFSAAQTQSAEALLLQFDNLRTKTGGLSANFDQAVRLSQSMAENMGGDAASAARLLGRALENPTNGMMMLRRQYGSFTPEQEAAIKAMTKAGDVAGAQTMILDLLEKKVGPLAEAMGNTLSGQIEKTKASMEDFLATLGAAAAPAITEVSRLIRELLDNLRELPGWMTKMAAAAIGIASAWKLGMISPIGLAISAIVILNHDIDLLAQHFDDFKFQVVSVWTNIKQNIFAVLDTLIAGVQALVGNKVFRFLTGTDESAVQQWQEIRDQVKALADQDLVDAGKQLGHFFVAGDTAARKAVAGVEGVADAVAHVGNTADDGSSKIRGSFALTADMSKKLIDQFMELRKHLEDLGMEQGLPKTAEEAKKLNEETEKTVVAIGAVGRELDWFSGLASAYLHDVASGWMEANAQVQNYVDSVKAAAKEAQKVSDANSKFMSKLPTTTTTFSGLGRTQASKDALNAPYQSSAMDKIRGVLSGLADFVKGLGHALSALNPLAILGDALSKALGDFLLNMTPIVELLAKALMPILKALFPIIKLAVIAFTYLGQVVFTVSGAFAEAIGWVVKAIGKLIDMLPFISGKGIMNAGQALIDLGKGFHDAASDLGDAREEIKKLTWVDGQAADAAQKKADADEEAARKAKELADEMERLKSSGEDMFVRALRAAGRSQQADMAAMIFEHRREQAAAATPEEKAVLEIVGQMEEIAAATQQQIEQIKAAADAEVDALGKQASSAEDQLRVLEDQLDAQRQTVDSLRGVISSLSAFRQSLDVGPLSPLPLGNQFSTAGAQFDALVALAKTGDIKAGQDLTEAGRGLIELSKSFSQGTYLRTVERVKDALDAVGLSFDQQLGVQDAILAELQTHTGQLQQQIDRLNAQIKAVQDAANEQIGEISGRSNELLGQLLAAVAALVGIDADTGKIDTNTGGTERNTGADLALWHNTADQRQFTIDFLTGTHIPNLIADFQAQLVAKDQAYQGIIQSLNDAINRLGNYNPGGGYTPPSGDGGYIPPDSGTQEEIRGLREDVTSLTEVVRIGMETWAE